jgi:peptide/nickel transport system permease protein
MFRMRIFSRFPPLVEFILKRLLQAIPTVLAILTLNFLMLHLAPGDPLLAIVGQELTASAEWMDAMRAKLGLDRPLHVQYFDYLSDAVRGDLGFSLLKRAPVLDLVLERLFNTFLLAFTSMILSVLIGVGLGLFASKKPYSFRDNFFTFISVIGLALPIFWFGQIMIQLFAIRLKWLPVSGVVTIGSGYTGWDLIKDKLLHMVMPVITLSIGSFAFLTRLTRSTMLNVSSEDFILTAKAKGLSENAIMFKHAFRNALLPLTTSLTLRLGFIISGALLTETVFSWPGIGRLTFEALGGKDYPLIMGIFVITCTMVVLAVLLADILYALIDPRIRYR